MSTPAEVAAAALATLETKVVAADAALEARDNAAPIPPTVETPAELVPGKTRGDLGRDAIYARAAANRARPGDESQEAMREAVQQLNTGEEGTPFEQGQPDIVTNPQAVVQSAQPTPAATPTPVAPVNQSAPPLANSNDLVTIRVEGREIAVSAAEVMRAGTQTLQKERAADIRLQRVSLAEQQIALDRAALDQRAAEISRATTPTGAAQPNANGNLPQGGQPQAGGLKQALDALLDSDTSTAATALEQVIAVEVEKRVRGAAAPTPTPTASTQIPAIAAPWNDAEVQNVNDMFDIAFKDIVGNPTLKAAATARIVQEMQNPINRLGRVPLMTLAANVGAEIRESFGGVNPQPPANIADELAARRTLAARVPGVPTPGAPRTVPTAPAETARQKPSDVVANMRKARGQSV